MLGSRIVSVGNIRPRADLDVDIYPPMRPDEQPVAVHYPGGALLIIPPQDAVDRLTLRNTSDRAVAYTLVMVPKVGIQIAQALSRFISR